MGGVNAAKENEFMVQKQVREALSGRGDDSTPSPDVIQDSVLVSSAVLNLMCEKIHRVMFLKIEERYVGLPVIHCHNWFGKQISLPKECRS